MSAYRASRFPLIKQYTVKLNEPAQGTAGKTDCPFSMPTGRKEQPSMTIWILLLLPDTCHRTGHIRMISTVLWQRSKKLTNPDCKEIKIVSPSICTPLPCSSYQTRSGTPDTGIPPAPPPHPPSWSSTGRRRRSSEGVHGRVGGRRLKKEALIGIHGHSRRLQQQGTQKARGGDHI